MKHNIHPSDELKLLFDNKVKRKVYINGTIDVSVIVTDCSVRQFGSNY